MNTLFPARRGDWSCLRPTGEMIRGTGAGILFTLLLALPLGWVAITRSVAHFERCCWERLAEQADFLHRSAPLVSHAEGMPSVEIMRERYGTPVLPKQALSGVRDFGASECDLLVRLRIRKQQPNTIPHRALDRQQTAAQSGQTASVVEADADHSTAGAARPYEPDLLIIEICRERVADVWHYTLEIGYQSESGVWQRIGWWRYGGIAAANELIRFEPDPYFPWLLRKVTMPIRAESATGFIAKDLHRRLKELNPDYKSAPPLSLKSREFEVGVALELKRILPEATGSIGASWDVFFVMLISGALPACMVLVTTIGLLSLACRALLGIIERRWLGWLKFNLQRRNPRAVLRVAARHAKLAEQRFGLPLPSLAGCSKLVDEGMTAVGLARAKEHVRQLIKKHENACYLPHEAGKFNLLLGLLGTLVFLVFSLLSLSIDGDPAKMQSIIANVVGQLALAFLTTVASSSLLRLLEFCHVLIYSAEGRLADEVFAVLEAAQSASENRVRRRVRKNARRDRRAEADRIIVRGIAATKRGLAKPLTARRHAIYKIVAHAGATNAWVLERLRALCQRAQSIALAGNRLAQRGLNLGIVKMACSRMPFAAAAMPLGDANLLILIAALQLTPLSITSLFAQFLFGATLFCNCFAHVRQFLK